MDTNYFQKNSNFKIFVNYILKHKGLFILDLSCALFVSLIDLAYPFISRMAMYNWLPNNAYKTFFIVMTFILMAYVIKSFLYYIVFYYGHRFGTYVEADMKRDLFKHLQTLELSFFDNNRVGQLMARLTTDLFEIVELAHHGPEDILISFITIIGSLIILSTIEWRLTLVLACIIPAFIFILLTIRTKQMNVSLKVKKTTGSINAQIESNLSGIRTGKAFGNEEIEYKKFNNSVNEYVDSKKGFYFLMASFNSIMEFFCSIMSIVVMAVGGYLIMKNDLNYIDLLTFTLYITTFITPIRKLVSFAEVYSSGSAGLTRFCELMRIEPSIKDKENAKELKIDKGEIVFKNVCFSYKKDEGILNDINIKIKGGETIAFVGSSGGGKTTLCQLIPRFYDVDSGEILIDKQNIQDVLQDSLHKQIGIVQQDVFLFADSIKENIRYGNPNASDDEVYKAAKQAEIYDDIAKMPNGFDTYVGERGVLLSGGQKQRIAIARIFLKNPPIIILDEATSALDSITEASIQNAFDNLAKGRTCLIIAHRLSTIKKAKRIVVINNGRIEEIGTEKELLAKDGVYSKLYITQNGNRG